MILSNKLDPKSGEGQGLAESNSVYDFLYHDARRVGSYLAQFNQSGLLQAIKETNAVDVSKLSKAGASAGLKVPVLANAGAHFEDSAGTVARDVSEKQFDPYWLNAISLLTYLDQASLIRRGLSEARIGQFVVMTGNLSIIDTRLMQLAWSMQSIQKIARSGNAKQPVASKGAPNPMDIALDLLKILPHTAQATLRSTTSMCWCSLDNSSIVTDTADILLKHGKIIAGEWSMLGVLDANPENEVDQLMAQMEATAAAAVVPTTRVVATMVEALAPLARTLLGRPPEAYGVTPLLIFREIGR